MFDFKHVAVTVNGKTGPCTFSRRPITNASRLTMMRNSSDDARTMREAYAKAGLSELMHDGTFRAEMKAAKKVKTMAEPCNTWVAKTFGVDNAHDLKCRRFPCKAIHSKLEKYKAHACSSCCRRFDPRTGQEWRSPEYDEINPIHISEQDMVADPFTKYLVFPVWRRHMWYLLNQLGSAPPRHKKK